MKHIKRLFSTLLVLALALTFAIPAFAADGDVTITMKEKNDEALGSYSAYQLMTVTVAPGAAEGDGSTGYSYTVNSKYSAILQEVTGKTTDEDVIKYLESIKDNAAEVRKFADDVYAKLAGTDGDYTADAGVFTVPMGYYLIVETDDNGITSLVMLDTADKTNIDVTTKEELPTREKKVDEKNDTTGEEKKLQDGADYDIGDDVPFTLSGNIAADYMSYTKGYKLVLHDKMEDGLTFDPNSVVVKIRGVELTKGTDYTLNYPISEGDGCTFEIVIEDLQKVDAVKNAAADAAYTYEVKFNAELNTNAVVGADGNHNEFALQYSNDHYEDTTYTTPFDKVTVFTFQLDVDKVDGDGQPLEGAGFTLYKETPDGSETLEGIEGKFIEYKSEVTVQKIEKSDGTYTYTASFKGLDSGKYVLVETTTPPGYNTCDPIKFEVAATYETESEDPQLTGLVVTGTQGENPVTFKVKADKGEGSGHISTSVINNTGAELPSTGGMGTTLFYIVGGILVAAAVILLVTKKRVNSDK